MDVVTGVTVSSVWQESRLVVEGSAGLRREVDLVLVVVGVRPDTALARSSPTYSTTSTKHQRHDHLDTDHPHNADDSSPDHGESITSREPSSMSGHRGARSRVGGL
jgi:hypothetical protein